MTVHAYLFEAKFIQSYILGSNRLREMIGASELIDGLCPEAVEQLCQTLGIGDRVRFSRNAGGACYLFSEDEQAVARFAAAWPLLVQQLAPGLSYAQARGRGVSDEEAYAAAHGTLLTGASRMPPELPLAGPLVQFAPRTGRAAVRRVSRHGNKEVEDASTRAKLRRADAERLIARFADLPPAAWPTNLDPADGEADRAFPFAGDRLLGVVHADGNGLGQLMMRLRETVAQTMPDRFTHFFLNFSRAIGSATVAAARAATAEVLLPARKDDGPVPARPIVLGGDDLSILVRADLALAFTRSFLLHFEHTTAEAFAELRREFPALALPDHGLTACAGITYVHAGHPFQSAYALAESLCARAKALRHGEEVSALAFHRVTTALVDDWGSVVNNELTTHDTDLRLVQTMEAYAVRNDTHLPALDTLLELCELLASPAMARGPVRQLITLLAQDPAQARRHYSRWREIMRSPPDNARDGAALPRALHRFDDLLVRLTGADAAAFETLPFAEQRGNDTVHVSPLGDALSLIAAGNQNTGATEPSTEAAA